MIAASVGVNIPFKMPPNMTTTVSRDRKALSKGFKKRWKSAPSFLTISPFFTDNVYHHAHGNCHNRSWYRPSHKQPSNRHRGHRAVDNRRHTEGGIMGPTREDAPVTANEKSSSYPASRMALKLDSPRPPASAIAAPDIPANTTDARILAWPRPPVTCPHQLTAEIKNTIRHLAAVHQVACQNKSRHCQTGVNVLAPSVRRCTTMINAISFGHEVECPAAEKAERDRAPQYHQR